MRICSDIVSLLSRDLKRDVAKKLEKLEKRTQRAIAELISVLWCRRDGVHGGHSLFQRDYTMLAGSLVSCCWAREALAELGGLPKRIWEAVGPTSFPRAACTLGLHGQGDGLWALGFMSSTM